MCSATAWSPEVCLEHAALAVGTQDIITHSSQELLVNCTTNFGYKPFTQLTLVCDPWSMASPHQQATGLVGVQVSVIHVPPELDAPAVLAVPSMILRSLHPPGSPQDPLLGTHSTSFPLVHIASPGHPHPCPSPPTPPGTDSPLPGTDSPPTTHNHAPSSPPASPPP